MKQQMRIQLTAQKVTVSKQKPEELLEDNKEFIDWLINFYGDDAKEAYIAYLKEELAFVPRHGTTIELPIIMMGQGTLSYYPYTTSVKYGRAKDPINLIFYGQGAAKDVNNILQTRLTPVWNSVPHLSATQYTFIDDTSHGGTPNWVKMSYALSDKPGLTRQLNRKHIRIFDGSKVCNHTPRYGSYSLGSVHEDAWHSHIPHFGQPVDFDNSQAYVERAFVALSKTVSHVQLQPQGEIINSVKHDGLATAFEV